MSDWQKIGTLPVDAGCIMLVDPCYVLPDSRQNSSGDVVKEAPYDYKDMLEGMEEEGWPREFKVKPKNYSMPLGMIVESGYGDGEYPVYAEYNREGRLVKVMVDFDPEDEDY